MKVHKLKDGTRVLCIPVPRCRLVRIEIYVPMGSAHFAPGKEEITHFMEHMIATFTSLKHPSAQENMRALYELGVDMNASTHFDHMVYHMEGMAAHTPLLLDYALNTFTDFFVDETIFTNEKKAVANELGAIESQERLRPDVWDSVRKALYGKHPFSGWSIQKRIASLSSITPQDITTHWHQARYFGGKRSVICVCGDIAPAAILRSIRDHWSQYAPAKHRQTIDHKFPLFKIPKSPKVSIHLAPTAATATIEYFVPCKDVPDQDVYIFSRLLPAILTDDLNGSRLYKKLRTQLGMVYYVHSQLWSAVGDRRLFTITTEVNKVDNVRMVCRMIQQEVERLMDQGMTEADIGVFRQRILVDKEQARLAMTLGARSADEAYPVFYGRRPQHDFEKRLRSLTPAYFLKTIRKYLQPQGTLVFISTPKPIS